MMIIKGGNQPKQYEDQFHKVQQSRPRWWHRLLLSPQKFSNLWHNTRFNQSFWASFSSNLYWGAVVYLKECFSCDCKILIWLHLVQFITFLKALWDCWWVVIMVITSGLGRSSKLSRPLLACTCSAFILDPLFFLAEIYLSASFGREKLVCQ